MVDLGRAPSPTPVCAHGHRCFYTLALARALIFIGWGCLFALVPTTAEFFRRRLIGVGSSEDRAYLFVGLVVVVALAFGYLSFINVL